MYVLNFDGENGSERYEICTQAILQTGKQVQIGEWDTVIDLLRRLKKIGNPTLVVNGVQLYDLQPQGGVVTLEKAGHTLLLDFLQQPIWRPHVLEQVAETREWLKSLTWTEPDIKSTPVAHA